MVFGLPHIWAIFRWYTFLNVSEQNRRDIRLAALMDMVSRKSGIIDSIVVLTHLLQSI
jgi:hypothetical protein